MDLNLGGRVAMVSGASRGIGRAIASELAQEGVDVAICARDEGTLGAAARHIASATGRRIVPITADLSTPEGVQAFADGALRAFGRVDILVNNAGATMRGDLLSLDDDAWASGFALKHMGYVRLTRAVWPHLPRDGRGRVINVIGGAGRTPSADFMVGGGVNAALLNFTRALASMGSPENILVNGISPGSIRTERFHGFVRRHASIRGISLEEAEREMVASQPLKRIGTPQDVAALVAFLCSDRASFIHGTAIAVDGGTTPCI